MVIDYIWQNANPEHRAHLRTANEARAAAYYAAWRALTAPFRALVQTLGQALSQARREGETFRALNRLGARGDNQATDPEVEDECLAEKTWPRERRVGNYSTTCTQRRERMAAGPHPSPLVFSRREFLRDSALTVAGTQLALGGTVSCSRPTRRDGPNVLFIVVDDLNDWVGALGGHPRARTPHIDALAARGVLFHRAYTASPLCGPSRAVVMTGRSPDTTGIYSNRQFWTEGVGPANVIPARFSEAGYHTAGIGKLFHAVTPLSVPEQLGRGLPWSPLGRLLLSSQLGPWDEYQAAWARASRRKRRGTMRRRGSSRSATRRRSRSSSAHRPTVRSS